MSIVTVYTNSNPFPHTIYMSDKCNNFKLLSIEEFQLLPHIDQVVYEMEANSYLKGETK